MAPTSLSFPSIDLVYTKTDAGRAEVLQRTAGLTARQRGALIMLDGQRPATALAALMPLDEVGNVLATLVELRLIGAPPSVTPPAAVVPGPLAGIKAELIQTAEAYLGLMAADVVTRINQSRDATQLLRVLGQWHMAMQASKSGRSAAESVLEKTRAALEGAATV